jgi:hypothetical protein
MAVFLDAEIGKTSIRAGMMGDQHNALKLRQGTGLIQ